MLIVRNLLILIGIHAIAMLAVATFLIGVMMPDLIRAVRERSPAHLQIERWSSDYHGEQWVAVEGNIAPGLSTENPASTWLVPLVPNGFKNGDPITVVVVADAKWREANDGRVTAVGTITQSNLAQMRSLMPFNKFSPRVVRLNQGHAPIGIAIPLTSVAISIAAAVAAIILLRGVIRKLRSSRDDF